MEKDSKNLDEEHLNVNVDLLKDNYSMDENSVEYSESNLSGSNSEMIEETQSQENINKVLLEFFQAVKDDNVETLKELLNNSEENKYCK